MTIYKYELRGVEILTPKGGHVPLMAWFEAESDSEAITSVSRISQAVAVSHGMTLYRCVGVVPTTVVLENNALAPRSAW